MEAPMSSEEEDKPLRRISRSFEQLASELEAGVEVGEFSTACAEVSPLFGCLGIAFKFAEMDYVAKVRDLSGASGTLPAMLDHDVRDNRVRIAGSHSRNLLRVKRGIDMIKVLFQEIISTEGDSLRGPASKAYAKVFAPHHGWAIRKAVAAGLYALPTRAQLLKKLNEDVESLLFPGAILTPFLLCEITARIYMQSYITASGPLILYIDNLFLTRQLGIDW